MGGSDPVALTPPGSGELLELGLEALDLLLDERFGELGNDFPGDLSTTFSEIWATTRCAICATMSTGTSTWAATEGVVGASGSWISAATSANELASTAGGAGGGGGATTGSGVGVNTGGAAATTGGETRHGRG